MKVIVRPTSYT